MAGAAALAATAFSIKAAADFETKLAEISTLLDDTSQVDAMGKAIQRLSNLEQENRMLQGRLQEALRTIQDFQGRPLSPTPGSMLTPQGSTGGVPQGLSAPPALAHSLKSRRKDLISTSLKISPIAPFLPTNY